jgi:hypothetical protein
MKSGLRDDRCVGKVVEKLERTDTAVDDSFAVRTRRAPEPVLRKVQRPTGRWTGGSRSPSEGSAGTRYVYSADGLKSTSVEEPQE